MLGISQYSIFKSASAFLCLLPYSCLARLAAVLGRLYYYFAPKQRNRAIEQIKERFNLSQAEAEKVIHSSFIKLGMTFLEFMYMPNLNQEFVQKHIVFENKHYLDEAMAEGKGVIFVSGHYCNWEWFGAAVAILGTKVAHIIKKQPNDEHTRLLNEYRHMFGIETYASGTNEIVGAAKALKKGTLISFLVDQDAGKHEGIFVEFMGEMASTHIGPAVFAKKFKAPIVSGFIFRDQALDKLRVTFNQPFYFEDTGNEEQDIYNITLKINQIIEQAIKARPDEWMWFKRRWDTPYVTNKN
ncbi:MAG: lysophospholipid acyltransferase family protein [Sporomusaceae bacterium]|jgi:KDO2-lipid IV(A) lauroyltransferase|nr:lysophospholipid acyltransferase family protein [Sporomusaceae bacterium]